MCFEIMSEITVWIHQGMMGVSEIFSANYPLGIVFLPAYVAFVTSHLQHLEKFHRQTPFS